MAPASRPLVTYLSTLCLFLSVHSAGRAEPETLPATRSWNTTTGTWERDANNGFYVVRVKTQDPAKVKDLGDLRVEGVPLLSRASAINRMASSITVLAEVTDGRLTLANAAAVAGRINAIEVAEAYSPDRVMAFHLIGWSSPDPADRCVGLDMKRLGWPGFVRHVIEPELRWGVRRIVLSNPFGCLPGEVMQFDQFLHAKDAKLAWLTEGFARAWRPIADSGVEVVCYLGKLSGDQSFPSVEKDPAGWERRFWESIQPAMDAKMTVALDASAGELPESYRAADLLEAKGVKVYLEPRPSANATRWFKYPFFTVDTFWTRSNPALYPDSNWAARNEQLSGEVLRIINAPPEGKTWEHKGWIGPYVKDILRDGHTAAAPVPGLMSEQIPLHDLLRKDTPRPPQLDRARPISHDPVNRTGNPR